MNVTEAAIGPQFVDVLCYDCVVRVDVGDAECPFVSVRLIMGHPPAEGWRFRLREAWRVLRGEGHEWFDFYTRAEVDQFVAAIERAKTTLPLAPLDQIREDCLARLAEVLDQEAK